MSSIIVIVLCCVSAAFSYLTEEAILSEHSDVVFRPDSTMLCIVTDFGDTVFFNDRRHVKYAEDWGVYRLVDHLEEVNLWVVETSGYEWMDWRIVSGVTGSVDTVISAPVLSPNARRLLCFNEDITAGFIPNGIQIWKVSDDGLELEFEDVEVPWGPVEARWADDSTIVFQAMSYDQTWEMVTEPGKLLLQGDGAWRPLDPEGWVLH